MGGLVIGHIAWGRHRHIVAWVDGVVKLVGGLDGLGFDQAPVDRLLSVSGYSHSIVEGGLDETS
jgi:hypothetical protein